MSNLRNLSTQLDALIRATAKAAATVMGPDDTTLRSSIVEDTELLAAVRGQTLTGQQLADLIAERILEPARQNTQQQQQSALDTLDKSFEAAKTNADKLTNNYVLQPRGNRAKAKQTFDASILAVTDIITKIATIDRRVDRVTDKINKLCYKQGDSSGDDDNDIHANAEESGEAQAAAAQQRAMKAHAETKLLEARQLKREQLTKEQSQLQQQLFRQFDQTLGGWSSMSKHDKTKLSLPKMNKQVVAREIADAFKAYMSHRAAEYYAILPYIN